MFLGHRACLTSAPSCLTLPVLAAMLLLSASPAGAALNFIGHASYANAGAVTAGNTFFCGPGAYADFGPAAGVISGTTLNASALTRDCGADTIRVDSHFSIPSAGPAGSPFVFSTSMHIDGQSSSMGAIGVNYGVGCKPLFSGDSPLIHWMIHLKIVGRIAVHPNGMGTDNAGFSASLTGPCAEVLWTANSSVDGTGVGPMSLPLDAETWFEGYLPNNVGSAYVDGANQFQASVGARNGESGCVVNVEYYFSGAQQVTPPPSPGRK